MNILNLLIKEKRVAGIEIDDTHIRIAYFRPRKKSATKTPKGSPHLPENELVLIEEPLAAGIVSGGVVRNVELLGTACKTIWNRAKLTTYYAIASIPPNTVYSRTFTFPKSMSLSRLSEAADLAIDFQMPLKKSDSYIRWERIGDPQAHNTILISGIAKDVAKTYMHAFDRAGINILALESHLASIARSIASAPNTPTLVTKTDPQQTTFFILENGTVSFARTVPASFIQGDDFLVREAAHIRASYEAEKKTSVTELSFADASVKDEYLAYPELKNSNPKSRSQWLVALGAAFRGQIPKGNDNHISLLSVGTAEAYGYQRIVAFVTLVRNMTIGVSAFFVVAYVATYLFVYSLPQTSHSNNLNLSASTISGDELTKENRIRNINALTGASREILSTAPQWSIVLDAIASSTYGGITISHFSATSVAEPITIVGQAKDRNRLNQFKKTLQDSPYATAVELPITHLEKKGDIPFSISFRLKDPTLLYYH